MSTTCIDSGSGKCILTSEARYNWYDEYTHVCVCIDMNMNECYDLGDGVTMIPDFFPVFMPWWLPLCLLCFPWKEIQLVGLEVAGVDQCVTAGDLTLPRSHSHKKRRSFHFDIKSECFTLKCFRLKMCNFAVHSILHPYLSICFKRNTILYIYIHTYIHITYIYIYI